MQLDLRTEDQRKLGSRITSPGSVASATQIYEQRIAPQSKGNRGYGTDQQNPEICQGRPSDNWHGDSGGERDGRDERVGLRMLGGLHLIQNRADAGGDEPRCGD